MKFVRNSIAFSRIDGYFVLLISITRELSKWIILEKAISQKDKNKINNGEISVDRRTIKA